MTFAEGFLGLQAKAAMGNPHKAFDWDKAAEIIKDRFSQHPDLVAEAGLQRDFDHTGGVIFCDGEPTNKNYTYLSSNWAIPTLILSWDGQEQEEIECFSLEDNSRFDENSKWDDQSISILGINLTD